MQVIACFGDSLVQGFPFGKEYSWTAEVERQTSISMLNYGVCGECCDDIFTRMKCTSLPQGVRHILFFGGANDILQRRPLDIILEDMDKAIKWCQANNYRLCLVLPLISADENFNLRLDALKQQMLKQFAEKCFLLEFPKNSIQCAYVDGVHPNSSMYTSMGAYAVQPLLTWLNQ